MDLVLFVGNPLTNEVLKREFSDVKTEFVEDGRLNFGIAVEDELDEMLESVGYSDGMWWVYDPSVFSGDMCADFSIRMERARQYMLSDAIPPNRIK
jgi:hypothetical protein